MALYVLSGAFKGQKLFAPDRRETRPATSLLRSMVFDSCQMIIEKARVLDPFSGSGAMGIEAFSRGAEFVTFNDLSRECLVTIEKNLEKVNKRADSELFQMDAFALLESLAPQKPYDIILLHPPYPIGKEGYERLIHLIIQRKDLLASDGLIFLEVPGQLCKELTPLIEKGYNIKKCKKKSTWALFSLHL